ncbi:MAG: FKBP-type peptidyl-prolyl cis-trans isomerase [Bacteroidales bacterium]|jgi:FKBP-type peptidyl-prolyl cis-trans isomerase|nr:FKBP-type peptidyl-prolyl cis-trans isomerase [Bacteroidales bacterium]
MNSSKRLIYSVLTFAVIVLASCGSKPNYKVSIKNADDSAAYYIGHIYGEQMTNSGLTELNIDALARGWQDANNEVKLEESMDEINAFMMKYFEAARLRLADKALKEGQDFLKENEKKQGIVTMPSGLQYRIIREGTGIKPAREDMVDVVYHGTLIDGTVFDSSKDNNDTVSFSVMRVVPGFSEALTLMNEGSVWEVYIPAEMGYGENPHPQSGIKPNSVLVFEIDLVKVNKGEEKK